MTPDFDYQYDHDHQRATAGRRGATSITGTAIEDAVDGFRVLIRPNRSLTPISMLMFMGGFSILTLSIAIVFVLQGYWLVLPFAGLEILFVAVAFWYVNRKGEDYDLVAVDNNHVSITQRVDGRDRRYEFDRHWARVSLAPGERRMHACRLFIGSHGKRVEIARALPEEGREELRQQLNNVLKKDYRSQTESSSDKSNAVCAAAKAAADPD